MTGKQELVDFFEQMPAKDFRKLAARIELDRTANRFGLPHDQILSLLRPRLARMGLARHCTPQRIACQPFEDLLVVSANKDSNPVYILRRHIALFWALMQDLGGGDFTQICEAFITAQTEADDTARQRSAERLWAFCHRILAEWLEENSQGGIPTRKGLSRCGDLEGYESLQRMANILAFARTLEKIKQALPRKPIAWLGAKHVTLIKAQYESLANEQPGAEVYLLQVLLARLLHPYQILRVFRALSWKHDDALTSGTDLALVGERIIASLEAKAEHIVQLAERPKTPLEQVVTAAEEYAEAFKNITQDLGIRRSGNWGQRMMKSRGLLSDCLKKELLQGIEGRITDILGPISGAGIFRQEPVFEDFQMAEQQALMLIRLSRIAEQISLSSVCSSSINNLRRFFESYSAGMIEALARTPKDRRTNARKQLGAVVRLLEIINHPDTAYLLWRRGMATLDGRMLSG